MKVVIKETVKGQDAKVLVDFIASYCELSKIEIKKSLTNGAGWIRKKGAKSIRRFRKAKTELELGDKVEFYYDKDIQLATYDEPEMLLNKKTWGIWYKPVNLLSQGTKYGDHCAMDKLVADIWKKREVFLIHRLDKEASGIMVVAYTKEAAKKLSHIWARGTVRKVYQAEVLGEVKEDTGAIDYKLDGKDSRTTYKFIDLTEEGNSLLEVRIQTGRFHQIRRHFDMLGHPLIGDPKYGKKNKDSRGLQLVASEVHFKDPFSQKNLEFCLPEKYRLF